MSEETGITVLGALGIIAAVVLTVLLIRHLLNQQNPGPQPGPAKEPGKFE
jgi:predicted PurR-regulated permease PerM